MRLAFTPGFRFDPVIRLLIFRSQVVYFLGWQNQNQTNPTETPGSSPCFVLIALKLCLG